MARPSVRLAIALGLFVSACGSSGGERLSGPTTEVTQPADPRAETATSVTSAVPVVPAATTVPSTSAPGRAAASSSTKPPRRLALLVYTRTSGFRHSSIPNAVAAVQELGRQSGLAVDVSEDPAAFTPGNLARYAAVMFLLTTGDVLDDAQQKAFEEFIGGGGGFVGVHSASDTEYDWPFYGALVGAYFARHPAPAAATLTVEDADHTSTAPLPRSWTRTDEWYDFQNNPRAAVRVLLRVEESTYADGGMGSDHPISWCHGFAGGRSWYTGLGHTDDGYGDPIFRQHLLGGIRYALGDTPRC